MLRNKVALKSQELKAQSFISYSYHVAIMG